VIGIGLVEKREEKAVSKTRIGTITAGVIVCFDSSRWRKEVGWKSDHEG